MIGTGASGVQIIPQLARKAAKLTVLQRSAPWILPRGDHAISPGMKNLYRKWPLLQWLHRNLIYLMTEIYGPFVYTTFRPLKMLLEGFALGQMKRVVKDPQLREKLTPNYTIGCKRVLIADDYYPALTEPHVSVETTGCES